MAWCRQCNEWNSDDDLPCPQCGTQPPIDPAHSRKHDGDDLSYAIGTAIGVIAGGIIGALIGDASPETTLAGAFLGLFPGLLLGATLNLLSRTRQALVFLALLVLGVAISTFLR